MNVVASCAGKAYLLVVKVVSVSFSAACCIIVPLHCCEKKSRAHFNNWRECPDSAGFDAFYLVPTTNSIH